MNKTNILSIFGAALFILLLLLTGALFWLFTLPPPPAHATDYTPTPDPPISDFDVRINPPPQLPKIPFAAVSGAQYTLTEEGVEIEVSITNPTTCPYRYSYDVLKANPDKVVIQVYAENLTPANACAAAITTGSLTIVIEGDFYHLRSVEVNWVIGIENE